MRTLIPIVLGVGVFLLFCQAFRLLLRAPSEDGKPDELEGSVWLDRRRKHDRWTGWLTVSIALLIAINFYLWSRHLVVFDLEGQRMLVYGATVWPLRVLVFGYPLTATLIAQTATAVHGLQRRPLWLLGTGFVVSLTGLSYVELLTRDAPDYTLVYGYSLYTPWLLLWAATCIVDCVLVLAALTDADVRRAISLMLPAGIAALADGGGGAGGFWDSDWNIAYLLMYGLATLFAVRAVVVRLNRSYFVENRLLKATLVGLAMTGLFAFWATHREHFDRGGIRLAIGVGSCLVATSVLLFKLVSAVREGPIAQRSVGARLVLAVALLMLATLSLDLFFLRVIPPLWNLLLATTASITLVELASEGPLLSVKTATALWGTSSIVCAALRGMVASASPVLQAFQRTLASVRALTWLPRAGLTALLAAALTVCIDEAFSRGSTLVQTFEVAGEPEDGTDHVGRTFAALVVNQLNGIALDLDNNVQIAASPALRSHFDGFDGPMQQAALQTGAVEADLESDHIDLGPLGKIRIGKALAWVQRAVRAGFGTRHVEGMLVREGTAFRLLAHTRANSWMDPPLTDPPGDLYTLARRLAFSVLNSNASWRERGMTDNQEAFADFLQATEALRAIQRLNGNRGTVVARQNAITWLRSALAADAHFAVAHYRLAMLLQEDRQYGGALEHLRLALAERPDFGLAKNALAVLLEGSDKPSLPRILTPGAKPDTRASQAAGRAQARSEWTAMLDPYRSRWSDTDRAYAHLGLCSLASTAPDEGPARDHEATFHCMAANALYESLPESLLAKLDRDALRARALNALGVRLFNARPHTAALYVDSELRGCDAAQLASPSPKSGPAWHVFITGGERRITKLFAEAQRLAPEDRVLACNLLGAQRAEEPEAGQVRPDSLREDRITLQAVAYALVDAAQEADELERPGRFREALAACDRGIAADPSNVELLNLYAYVHRLWWLTTPGLRDEPDAEAMGELAEWRARQAVRLGRENAQESVLAAVLSTLGEVLLVRGRPHEALQWLREANRHAPSHWTYNEVRSDLVEALVCSHADDETLAVADGLPGCHDALREARALTELIRTIEVPLETPFFSAKSADAFLDLERVRARCAEAVRPPDADDSSSLEPRVNYPAKRACGTALLVVEEGGPADAMLHLWGNGDDVWQSTKSFRKALAAQASHGVLFAQLTDAQHKPLSRRLTIHTLNATDDGCTQAEQTVRLAFKTKAPSQRPIGALASAPHHF